MRRAVASALSDCALASSCVVSLYMNHVSSPALRASTSTTSPTKETTYLPNSPLRRNQLLRTASMIGALLPCGLPTQIRPALPRDAGPLGNDGPDLITVAQRAAGIRYHQVAFTQPVADLSVGVGAKPDLDPPGLRHIVAHDLDARSPGPGMRGVAGDRHATPAAGHVR